MRVLLSAVLTLLLAGCSSIPADTTASPEPAGGPGSGEPQVIEWDGHSLVAVYADAPAHLTPSEDITRPVWDEGFLVAIRNATAIEFQMDWTGAPGSRVVLMAHTPHTAEGMIEYEIGGQLGTDERHLCIRVPEADLPLFGVHEHGTGYAGYWQPMFHGMAGGDIQVHLTVRVWGGTLERIPGAHGHDATDADELTALADVLILPHDECVAT